MNDLEGHSVSSGLPLFDTPYITNFLLAICSYNNSIVYLAPFSRYYHINSIMWLPVAVTRWSFSVEKIVEIASHVRFAIHV